MFRNSAFAFAALLSRLVVWMAPSGSVLAQEAKELKQNEVILFEHDSFRSTGRVIRFVVTDYQSGVLVDLRGVRFNDCLSSLRYNLDEDVSLIFYEHHEGSGRKLEVTGKGEIADTRRVDFKDCASAVLWTRKDPPAAKKAE